ncbi:MAG: carboxypeptidase regulatory-like domain-containing protein [Thermoplasmata archaeon]|nr:carboxypeptidase regulatory-like domain-containing protein [Candidatus Sysuiplasma acidicola]
MANNDTSIMQKNNQKRQDSTRRSWIAGHFAVLRGLDWETIGILALLVFFGAYLRVYFDFSQAIANGYPGLSGGSDADYYFRVLTYAMTTGHQLEFDKLLNYPAGSGNPFLPFYVWSTLLAAWPISFIFHLPPTASIYSGVLTGEVVAYVLISAFSGVVTIIVAYYLGKELFDRHTGIFAAAFMAFFPSIVSESTAGFGVHDPFILMLTAIFFFFLFRSLKTINGRRWVESYTKVDSRMLDFRGIYAGLRKYANENRQSLTYALMAGIVVASIANAWEGFAYLIVIVSLFYLIQSFIYKFKNRDTLALTSIYAVVGASLLLFSLPIYFLGHHEYPWYVVPVVFFIGTFIVGVIYTVTRDVPWLTVLASFVIGVLAVLAFAEFVEKPLLHTIVADILLAQSYFIKTAVYTTIAEALAPPFSLLALSLGGAIFFIAFAELVYVLYANRKSISDPMMLFAVWSIIAIFMAVSTVRFILDATTVFVILGGKGISSVIRWTNFGEVKKGFDTFGFSWSGAKKSIKLKHIVVTLFVAFLIVLPVVWTGIDAATPTTAKQSLNSQVYNILPSFLRPAGYTNNGSSPYYFGGFGYSLSTQNDYFPAAWEWLHNQTAGIEPSWQRPAYLSWWDYGSAVITKAGVPTVADDFQQGYHVASAVLFSQNQTQLISLLSARVMYGVFKDYGNTLPSNITTLLNSYGINSSYILSVYTNPAKYTQTVLANPQVYGPFAKSVTPPNVMWAVLMATLSKIGLNNSVQLYGQLSQLTHYFIGYFSVDTRLFPFSATNTGVFYAPAFLGGRPIIGPSVYNIPYNYYTLTASTVTGLSYPIQNLPPNTQVSSYSINYQPMFYNMTLYRFFMGYSGYDLTGQGGLQGLPGLTGSFVSTPGLQNLQPLPGWMMSHFFMAYRTAYFNPYPIQFVKDHPNSWKAIDVSTALKLLKKDPNNQNYTIDLSPQSDYGNGIVIMQYYPGAYVNGTVLLNNGNPAAGVRVTMLDKWGIPHDITYTNAQGKYSLIAPPGNDTVVFSTGSLSSPSARVAGIGQFFGEQTYNISYNQAMRSPALNTTTGLPAFNVAAKTMTLQATSLSGYVFYDNNRTGTFNPGVSRLFQNASVRITNTTTGQSFTAPASNGHYDFSAVLPGTYQFSILKGNSTITTQNQTTVNYASNSTQNLPVYPGAIGGYVRFGGGAPAAGVSITVAGVRNGLTETTSSTSNGSYSAGGLPQGNYTVSITSGGIVSGIYDAYVRSFNTTSVDITASSESHIDGNVFINGSGAAFAKLYFYANSGDSLPYVITTGDNGQYNVTIGSGNYTAYSIYYLNGAKYVLLQAVSVAPGQHVSENLFLTSASSVSGTVKQNDGVPAAFALILVQNGGASMAFRSDGSGNYSLAVPSGTYNIWAQNPGGAFMGQFTASSSAMTMNIAESSSMRFAGTLSSNTTGPNRGISGADMAVDFNGLTYHYYTGSAGSFSLYLPYGNSYSLSVSAFGMISHTFQTGKGSNTSVNLVLQPAEVAVSGNIASQTSLPSGIQVTFVPLASNYTSNSTVTVKNGGYSASLLPGSYGIVLTGYNNSSVHYVTTAGTGTLNVPVGSPLSHNVSIRAFYNLTLSFDYPAGSGLNGSTPLTRLDIFGSTLSQPIAADSFANGTHEFLPSGYYVLYAYASVSGRVYVFLDRITLNGGKAFQMNLTSAVNLSGAAYYQGAPLSSSETVTVTQQSTGANITAAVQSNGTFTVSLPSSSYSINITYSTTSSTPGQKYVVYYGEATVSLTSSTFVPIHATLHSDNSSVTGTVSWFYGTGARSNIEFTASSNTSDTLNVTTTVNGSFSASLQPGSYHVRVLSTGYTGSNYTTIQVVQGTSMVLNPVLHTSYNVTGSLSVSGIGPVSARVTFMSNTSSISAVAVNGAYSVPMPAGKYAVFASYSMKSHGTTYYYEYAGNLTLGSPAYVPITMNLKTVYSISMKVLSSQQNGGSGGFSEVTVLVNNTGDVPITLSMGVVTNGWYGSFSPAFLSLGTGSNSSAVVKGIMFTSAAVGGGNSSVYIQAYSPHLTVSSDTVKVSLSVPTVYSFNGKISYYAREEPGRVFSVNLAVYNNGNAPASFVVSISNYAELLKEGWTGGISTALSGPFNHNSTSFSLSAGQNQSVTITLTANSSDTPNVVPIGVYIVNTNTNKSSSMSVPISLPNPVVSLSGISVSGHGASVVPPPLFTSKRGIIIFILAAIVIADIYMAKRKRLIR